MNTKQFTQQYFIMTQQEGELLKNRIKVLEEENQRLHQQVDYLCKHLFGQKSEKTSVIFNGQNRCVCGI